MTTPEPATDTPPSPSTPSPSTPTPSAPPRPLHRVALPTEALEDWLDCTDDLPLAAAAALAEALSPPDDAVDGSLHAGPSPVAGRGLFTTAPFEAGAVITVCPLLRIPERLMESFADTTVYGHCFDLGDEVYGCPMGLATLLNHDEHPNAHCELDIDAAELWVHASRAIAAGEEITIDYTGGDAEHELWF